MKNFIKNLDTAQKLQVSKLVANKLNNEFKDSKRYDVSEWLEEHCYLLPSIEGLFFLIKLFTPEKIDKIIDEIIEVGKKLCSQKK